MTVYAVRLANGADTAPRVRMADTLPLQPSGPLQARSGVRPGTGAAVTVVAGTMQVQVTPFLAWVDGGASDVQAGFVFVSDATATLTLDAGDASQARVDTIAAVVHDDTADGSGSTDAVLVVVKGTPGAGAPALPGSAVALRDVNVPAGLSAGTGGLAPSHLGTDRRRWIVGAGGILPVSGTAERDALTAYDGMAVYRTDLDRLQLWNGTTWDTYAPDPLSRFKRGSGSLNMPAANTEYSVTINYPSAFDASLPVPFVTLTQDAITGSPQSSVRLAVTARTRSSFTVAGVRSVGTAAVTFDWMASAV